MIDIKKQQGGWAALTYEVSDGTKKYFLKVYEKNRASTRKWTSLIEQLLYDDQEGQERVKTINYLKDELKRLREY